MKRSPAQVLVIGAGPTGLVMAAALVRAGVTVRIVEKNASRTDKSKALGVHAGTLESLEQVFGATLPREMVTCGLAAREAYIHIGGNPTLKVDLSVIPSVFDFILILAQSETERLLESELERLGVQVERGIELASAEEREGRVHAKLKNAQGQLEEVSAEYLIGCDGAHSVTRSSLGIPFKGGSYTGDFILGDVALEWAWPYGSVHNFVSEKGALACFPMKGERRYRLIMIPRTSSPQTSSADIAIEEFERLARELGPKEIRVRDATWLTRFKVHHRIVKSFGRGRIYLAGDAAHIHSPVGGQGMNTGIQDALNLAHKLARVIRNEADPAVLKQYEKERMPIARRVMRGTGLVLDLALVRENAVVAAVRASVLPKVVGSRWVQKRILTAISQVNIARKEMKRRLS